jgi:hypothetical protein
LAAPPTDGWLFYGQTSPLDLVAVTEWEIQKFACADVDRQIGSIGINPRQNYLIKILNKLQTNYPLSRIDGDRQSCQPKKVG